MSEIATQDDSVFCRLCDPPYETSIAMWPVHMTREHGWGEEDFEAVSNAEVLDFTDPRDEA